MDGARRTSPGTAAGVAVSLTALLLTAPRPHAAVTELARAGASSDPTAPLVAAVALGAWAVSAWLALTVALVLLSRLPGLLGCVGRAVAARVAPATVRRAVEAALGLTVAVGALAPSAALAAAAPGPAAATVAGPAADLAWDLDWPSTSPAAPPAVRPPTASASSPTPTASAVPTPTAPETARPSATPPAARPAPVQVPVPPAVAPAVVRPSAVAPEPAPVVVRPGDSLWSLAEASLRRAGTEPTDRQVAQAWPRWWAANREVVGDDPDLLLPGTVLHPPAAGTS